jgi:hypothetical protein
MLVVQSSTVSYVHLFVFFLLVTGFNAAWSGLWKIRGLSAKRARSICGVHLLAGTVKEDYGAGSKIVLPDVGSMGSPEWSVPCV